MENIVTTIIMILIVACMPVVSKGEEPVDTVKVVKKADEVVVTHKGTVTRLEATRMDSLQNGKYYIYEVDVRTSSPDEEYDLPDLWEMKLPFLPNDCDNCSGRRLRRQLTGFSHVYWGWRFNYNDRREVKNGFEVGVRDLVGVRWDHGPQTVGFSIGAGFGMMRFLAQDGFCYAKHGDALVFRKISEGIKVDKSRFDVWRFHIPVLLDVPLGKVGNFSIGGVANLNTYASSKTQTISGDERESVKYKHFQQRLFTADLFASLTIEGIGIYATWSPMSVFGAGFGPELKGWSIGVDLLTF